MFMIQNTLKNKLVGPTRLSDFDMEIHSNHKSVSALAQIIPMHESGPNCKRHNMCKKIRRRPLAGG